MVVVKWSEKVEVLGDKIDAPFCSGLYKEAEGYIIPWSGTNLYSKMNCFTLSKYDNNWTYPGDN